MIVFITTFILFSIEALLHYNIGHEDSNFVFPNINELCTILITVTFFSFLNSIAVSIISKHFNYF